MTIIEFKALLDFPLPPGDLPETLLSLWYDRKGNWHKAHDIADSIMGPDGAWIHAYLHRKEGDIWNADYWYSRAGRSRPNDLLAKEWEDIVLYFLDQQI